MGDHGSGLGDIHIDLADRHSGGPCLAHTVYRPVGKIISIVRPIETGSGERTVHFQVGACLSDKSGRITLHGGKQHTGIGIDKTGGQTTGYPPVLHQIRDVCLLSELTFPLVGKSIPIGIIRRTLRQVAKLVQFEPVLHPVAIAVLPAWNIVGNERGGTGYVKIHLAHSHSTRGRLAHTVERPVGKLVPIVFPVQAGRTHRAVHFHIIGRLGDKPGGITPDRGEHHTGIRIDKAGGQPAGYPAILHRIDDQRILPELIFPKVGKSIPVGISPTRLAEISPHPVLKPVLDPIAIGIRRFRKVVCLVGGGPVDHARYLRERTPIGSRLADTVYRPVPESISGGRQCGRETGMIGTPLDRFRFGKKSRRFRQLIHLVESRPCRLYGSKEDHCCRQAPPCAGSVCCAYGYHPRSFPSLIRNCEKSAYLHAIP